MLVSRMLDIDYLIGLCVQVSKNQTLRFAEYKLAQMITLKHTLELIEPMRNNLKIFKAPLCRSWYKVYYLTYPDDHITFYIYSPGQS